MRADTVAGIRERIAATSKTRSNSKEKIASGDWRAAEPDGTRKSAFTARVDWKSGHAEAIRGTNDFQPASFLPDGAKARRAVGHTILDTPGETRNGTGFLISEGLFLTNQHVLRDKNEAHITRVVFDDELDERGEVRPTTTFALGPDTLFLTSDEAQLDYALVAVGARMDGSGAISDFGYCALSQTPDRHQLGINANIVQHPEGQRKIVVLRNNLVVARDDNAGRLFYETDTLDGSSGSPVFNDLWDVIALHHYGEPIADVVLTDGRKTRDVNEGIRVSSIYEDLSAKVAGLEGRGRELLEAALVLWKTEIPPEKRPRPGVRPPDVAALAEATMAVAVEPVPTAPGRKLFVIPEGQRIVPSASTETTIVLPLEITVRIGTPYGLPLQATDQVPHLALAPAPRGLTETKRIDRDYANRNGFDQNFVPGLIVDLSAVVAPAKAKIAPLMDGASGRAPGELIYQNFSVVMNKVHRVALLTATNIDGASYVAIDRKTGSPAAEQPRAEGDSWYKDTRIAETLTLTNDFYSAWSEYFDRGHLTRRNDPTWGDEAARANADTFHFTNCSPQHWKFNESIEFWQGVERYVLEQGLWETGLDKRLTVLQGPLYDAPQPLFADDVEIPNAFWKIVVWKGQGGLKAVALVVDQTDLLSMPRRGGAPPDDTSRAKVSQFRTTVVEIVRRSGLDLADLIPYDTATGDLPHVGEATRKLTSFSQIKIR